MPAKKAKEWTAAGAARFAREARISTAQFLASSPLAPLWELSKVLNSYGYHKAHLGDHDAAMDMLLGGLGYQRPYPQGWNAIAEMLVTDEARYVAEAELYVLSPHMCDVVTAAALTLTREDLQQLGEEDLPSPAGLVILPHPLLVRAVTGDLGDDRAYTWYTPARIWPISAGLLHARRAEPAVHMSLYHDAHGPVQPDSFIDYAARARAAGTPLPPLILNAKRCVPFHAVITDEQAADHDQFSRRTRHLGEIGRELGEARGDNENRVTGEYAPGSEIDDSDDLFMPRFLFAFWRLCEQRIAVPEHAPVNHSAQVLAERAGVSAQIRIVRLRHAEQPADPGASGREWKHRWTVRMHKVNQWYPSEGRHKVLYRGPYVKGPEGKPMLEGETVRGLVR